MTSFRGSGAFPSESTGGNTNFRLDGKVAVVTGGRQRHRPGHRAAVCRTRGGGAGPGPRSSDAEATASRSVGRAEVPPLIACDVTDQQQVKDTFARTVRARAGIDSGEQCRDLTHRNGREHDRRGLRPRLSRECERHLQLHAGCDRAHEDQWRRRDSEHGFDRGLGRAGRPLCLLHQQRRGHRDDLFRRPRLSRHNIRCNCISPARVHTPFVDGYLRKTYPGREQEMFEKLSHSQPIGRMAEPEEVASLALFLCSDEASFITGVDYPLDGGFFNLHGRAETWTSQLKEKVVLVTGGAKGIGAAIVRACASEGAIPVIVDRDAEQARLQNESAQARARPAAQFTVRDSRSRRHCSRAVDQTAARIRASRCAGQQRRRERQSRPGARQARANMWSRSIAIWCTTTAWRTTLYRT